jgi:hypothetical protein
MDNLSILDENKKASNDILLISKVRDCLRQLEICPKFGRKCHGVCAGRQKHLYFRH